MITTYFKNCIVGNLFGSKTTPPLPTEYYVGLSSTPPNVDGTGVTEPSSSAGYARIKLTNLTEPVSGSVQNKNNISFNESTASWGTIPYYVVFDSAAVGDGNLLMFDDLDVSRSVESYTVLTFKAGNFVLNVVDA